MDIFSATSKQVETATAPKVQNALEVRQVETPVETTKSARENKQNEEEIKNGVLKFYSRLILQYYEGSE